MSLEEEVVRTGPEVTGANPQAHGAASRDVQAPSRWRHLPWLVLAAGAVFTAWLLSHARPGIFYSGDGGLKFLFVEQFARGELAPDLRLPVEPWVKVLWSTGHFPFDWPFVFHVEGRTFAWCPLPFEYLTAPLYGLFGWRGLYVWPVAGLALLWTAVLRLCRRLGVGPAWTALALFAVVFCSPITIYGAMFWGHALGVALAFSGLSLLAAPALRSATANGLLGGLLLGLSVWIRSELVWLAFVAAGLLPFAHRLGIVLEGRRAFFAGLAVAGAGFLAWNAALYGDPLGFTSQPLLGAERDGVPRVQGILIIFVNLMQKIARRGPAVLLALAAATAALALRLGDARGRAALRLWALLAAAYALGVALVLPNVGGYGGKQFGPRYLLAVFPMAAIALAVEGRAFWARAGAAGRVAIGAVLLLALALGVRKNAVDGARDLAGDYALRIEPVLSQLRADPAEVVVATNPFISQELTSLFATKRFFRADSQGELERLSAALASVGLSRFLLVSEGGMIALDTPATAEGRLASLRVRPLGCYGALSWCVHEGRIRPLGAP